MELSVSTITAFQKGDAQAFEEIYRAESQRLARFIRRYVRSIDLTEDIFQEVWVLTWQKRDQLRDPRRFTSWFYQIARNCVFMELRKRRQKLQIRAFGELADSDEARDRLAEQPDPGPGPRLQTEQAQWIARVDQEILKLDVKVQEMLALRYGADLGLREIAELLEAPLGTICAKINRSLKRIRESLELQGLEWR